MCIMLFSGDGFTGGIFVAPGQLMDTAVQVYRNEDETCVAGEGYKKRDGKPGRRVGVEKGGKAQREAESWLGFEALRVVRRGLFQWMMFV